MAPIPLPLHKSRQLGMLLRTTRMNLGCTLQQVADAIDISVEMYGRIERGRMMPNETKLKRTCLRLGLDYHAMVARLRDENGTALD
jgi:transcriptional regulator with XRE-family HTH domain